MTRGARRSCSGCATRRRSSTSRSRPLRALDPGRLRRVRGRQGDDRAAARHRRRRRRARPADRRRRRRWSTIDGKFGVRAELEDADAFEGTLAKIMDGLPEFSDDFTVTKPKAGDRFYGARDRRRRELRGRGRRTARSSSRTTRCSRARSPPASSWTPRARRARSSRRPTPSSSPMPRSRGSGAGSRRWAAACSRGRSATCSTSASASTDGLTGRLELKIE